MTKADWSRRFDHPIPTPDGSIVQTIGEAAAYAARLPKDWQIAPLETRSSRPPEGLQTP